MAVRNCFIRGSVVRYVQLPKAAVDTQLLEDACRRGKLSINLHSYPRYCPLRGAYYRGQDWLTLLSLRRPAFAESANQSKR